MRSFLLVLLVLLATLGLGGASYVASRALEQVALADGCCADDEDETTPSCCDRDAGRCCMATAWIVPAPPPTARAPRGDLHPATVNATASTPWLRAQGPPPTRPPIG